MQHTFRSELIMLRRRRSARLPTVASRAITSAIVVGGEAVAAADASAGSGAEATVANTGCGSTLVTGDTFRAHGFGTNGSLSGRTGARGVSARLMSGGVGGRCGPKSK